MRGVTHNMAASYYNRRTKTSRDAARLKLILTKQCVITAIRISPAIVVHLKRGSNFNRSLTMYSLPILFGVFIASLAVASPETDIPSQQEFLIANDESLSPAHFGYTGVKGPIGWAGLSPNNALCSTGSWQSPINLNASIGPPAVNPKVRIPDGYGDFENLGTTVEVPAVGQTYFGGKLYQLQQFHFHTPSEHRINEEYFPLEIHLVHQASGECHGSRLVLAAVFEITTNGATTQLVSTLARQIHKIAVPGSKTRVYGLRGGEIISVFQNYRLYQYYGSLTTPPCSEGIIWLVAQAPLPLDVGSYLAFKRVLKFNSRYTQNTPGLENLIKVAASQLPK
ncbi:hypothetical protein D9615_006113 [Tricholomella constricta]|uniref:Carbonic anhydrase n=1 Tax=Tricholomella constricta TaxID=117010 RepID=A0A8H5M463_9AGAR|nr:hypothetical protein D9615_006113 [Tricholomella constricta]